MLLRKIAPSRERRRAPRSPREWAIEIKNAAGVWRGTSVDVSTVGMRVRVDKPLEPRRLMFISLNPGDPASSVWSSFSLVRQATSGEYGIRFVDLSERDLARLTRLLAV